MEISQETRQAIAEKMGLEPEELFNAFYRVLNGDLTTYEGFQNPLGKRIEAPKWNPDRSIDCGEGLHFVWGHPFLALSFVNRDNPRCFRIPAERIEEIVPAAKSGGKFRAKAYTLLPEYELTDKDPELSRALLTKISQIGTNRKIRIAAMIKTATSQRILSKIAREDRHWSVRVAAVGRLTSQRTLSKIAMEDEDLDVRAAAVEKLTSQKTLRKIAMEDHYWKVRGAAERRLAEISKQDSL